MENCTNSENICSKLYLDYICPTEDTCNQIAKCRGIVAACADALLRNLPESFRTAKCCEALEEALMWATKSLCVFDKEVVQPAQKSACNGEASCNNAVS